MTWPAPTPDQMAASDTDDAPMWPVSRRLRDIIGFSAVLTLCCLFIASSIIAIALAVRFWQFLL